MRLFNILLKTIIISSINAAHTLGHKTYIHQCFLLVFLLCAHSDTLDTVRSSHYQPATDLLAHSEHTYPQSHKSSNLVGTLMVFLGQKTHIRVLCFNNTP